MALTCDQPLPLTLGIDSKSDFYYTALDVDGSMNILTGGYKDNGGTRTLYVGFYSASFTNRWLSELTNNGDKDNIVSVKL